MNPSITYSLLYPHVVIDTILEYRMKNDYDLLKFRSIFPSYHLLNVACFGLSIRYQLGMSLLHIMSTVSKNEATVRLRNIRELVQPQMVYLFL